jgi:hypothetical protein
VYLRTTALYFSTVLELVQGPVIKYDEIFQALAVKGDVLHTKPLVRLTPPHPPYSRDSAPLGLSRVWQTEKHISGAVDFHLTTPSKPRSRNGIAGLGDVFQFAKHVKDQES